MIAVPEPTWTLTQDAALQNYYYLQGTPPFTSILPYLVRVLQQHFSSTDNLFNAAITDVLYTGNAADDSIWIGPSSLKDYRKAGVKPALAVKRLPVTTSDINLTPSRMLVNTGTVTLPNSNTSLFAGKHQVLVTANDGNIVELLAEEAWLFLHRFGPVILDDLNLYTFEAEALPEAVQGQIKENPALWSAALTVTWGRFFGWKIETELPY